MILSPFGRKFHFQTALSLQECRDRIDSISVTSSLVLNVYDEPVSSRRDDRFVIYSTKLGEAPSLEGELRSELGRTHIRGRAGSNRIAFYFAVIIVLLFSGIVLFFSATEPREIYLNNQEMLLLSVVVGGGAYFRLWRDSRAEPLIGYLEELLDATPVAR